MTTPVIGSIFRTMVSRQSRNKLSAISAFGSARYINRELSWLSFNRRIVDEAHNSAYPIFERVRFLAISASNLNEFYMVRVAGLRGQVQAGVKTPSMDGMTPLQQFETVRQDAQNLMHEQSACWRILHDELEHAGVHVLEGKKGISREEIKWLEKHFLNQIFPVLTPIATDASHPFPFIPNLGFCMVITLKKRRGKEILRGLVAIPGLLDRFIRLPGKKTRFIRIETVIGMFLGHLFPGFRADQLGCIRLIRDSEMEIDEEAEDLVRTFESALKRRRRGSVIRLTYNADMPDELRDLVLSELKVDPEDAIAIHGAIGLADMHELIQESRPELQFEPVNVRFPQRIRDFGGDIFEAIRKKDFVVHHPYESFDAVVQFVEQAARDKGVVAIKQTLYRTSNESPIIAALVEAAEAGKSVTAMVELKARFDEEANLRWARDLERAGAQVVYGFLDKKTHAKVNLVVRREGRIMRSYVHYGTGNYHPITAKTYTDISLFSCDPTLCRDAARLFNYMTGYAKPEAMEKISFSPLTLQNALIKMIETETANAKKGEPAAIWAKLNALVDPDIIDALYKASGAGVEIDLVVRGVCCLRPGVEKLSENIRVRSIVGRFLEHARIVCFANGSPLPSKQAKVFISSSDWMPRNLHRRIETLIPIENTTVRRQILDEIMVVNLKDDCHSWTSDGDGNYHRVPTESSFSAHNYFMTTPSLSGRGSDLRKAGAKVRQGKSK
jgi:polyphosphate kinase